MNNIPKVITDSLGASNLGTNKTFININGRTSKLETNQNAKIQYKLNNPIKLEIGDKVTLYQAFVNEAGLNTDTLSFQEDVTSTMKIMYYVPQQLFKVAQPTLTDSKIGTTATKVLPDRCISLSNYQDYSVFPNQSFYANDPTFEANITKLVGLNNIRGLFPSQPNIPNSDVIGGDVGTPCYLMESHYIGSPFTERNTKNTANLALSSNAFVKPAVGEITITIKAGNYEASSLAKNITEQFNGAFIQNSNNNNYLTDRLYNPDSVNFAGTNTQNPFGDQQGKATTRVFYEGLNDDEFGALNEYNRIDINESVTAEPGLENFRVLQGPSCLRSDFFVNPEGLELWERNTSNTALFDTNPLHAIDYARLGVPLDGSRQVPSLAGDVTQSNANNPRNVETFGYENDDALLQYYANSMLINVNPATFDTQTDGSKVPNRYVGTHSFALTYSDNKQNRFSIKNLHESFKLPNITEDNSASNFGGQQATKYNTADLGSNVAYPIDASMGVMVTNFGWEECIKTDIYKNLNTELISVGKIYGVYSRRYLTREYQLKTMNFSEFFATDKQARSAWSNTLWSRLGFSYEQFGDVKNNTETVQTLKPTDTGIKQARLDKYNMGSRKLKGIITHNDFDFSDIMACANLGSSPVQISSNNVNMYDSVTFAKAIKPDISFSSTSTTAFGSNPEIVSLAQRNEFSVLATSQSVDAELLPDLNAGNSYYLITSDIIKPNGLDNDGNPMNLIGIMSKENSSNDTIYSVNGIPNIITESKLVTELSVEIRNPDNTLVPDSIVGKASGFVLLLEKAIEPSKMEVKSI